MEEFINESGNEFTDISTERWRRYHYADGSQLFINKPLKLHVSESGGHRIFATDGISRYIKPEWRHIEWMAKDGKPHFIK